ncbi:hypothetical protein DM01DRAFT_1050815 [Hesseltinella vesiculosa]|uniref:G-protein coupled receptors family 1 profile domain-containing protein n=1 Tax=Hesseltinella vesiculosa TaxID=101127 RepID=A0A1X2GH94_9FUNG|nr:hypothetical protein DM01DRAFT_1050815 [Hesseltinella vesiculosa]
MYGWFPRPKPIESLALFGFLFNLDRMIHSIIMLTDAAPWPAFRLVLYDFAWIFGFSAFSCYFFGVAHTIAASNKIFYKTWQQHSERVDVMCAAVLLIPYILFPTFNILTGIYAAQGDYGMAAHYTSVNYFVWTCFGFILSLMVLFGGIRLFTILDANIQSKANQGIKDVKMINGSYKVKLTVFIGCLTIWTVCVIACLFAAARETIVTTYNYSIVLTYVIALDGTAATTVIALVILIDPGFVTNWSFGSSQSRSRPSEFVQSGEFTSASHHQSMSLAWLTSKNAHTASDATSAVSESKQHLVLPLQEVAMIRPEDHYHSPHFDTWQKKPSCDSMA